MFYELRQYQIVAGKMDEWVDYMETVIIPYQVGLGMVITASFRGEDETTYVWMRRFNSEQERKDLYAAVYDSDRWKNEIAPRVGEMLVASGVNVQRIIPTPHSVTQ